MLIYDFMTTPCFYKGVLIFEEIHTEVFRGKTASGRKLTKAPEKVHALVHVCVYICICRDRKRRRVYMLRQTLKK